MGCVSLTSCSVSTAVVADSRVIAVQARVRRALNLSWTTGLCAGRAFAAEMSCWVVALTFEQGISTL